MTVSDLLILFFIYSYLKMSLNITSFMTETPPLTNAKSIPIRQEVQDQVPQRCMLGGPDRNEVGCGHREADPVV